MTEMGEYWAEQHKAHNIGMLANYSLEQIQRYLNLTDYIKPEMKVLDIGVGTGREIVGMVKAGMDVYAMDITMEAYWPIMDIVEDFWLFEDIEQLPENKFDLVICHLVAQHSTDENLMKLMTHAIKSLKLNAVFAIQYATHMDPNHRTDESVEYQEVGAVCRTPVHMRKLVYHCKGIILHECKAVEYPEAGVSWNGLHISRYPR